MDKETFDLLVGLAAIGTFLLDFAEALCNLSRKLSTRRMARRKEEMFGKEAKKGTENK